MTMGLDILTLAASRTDKPKYEQPDWGAESTIVEVLPETKLLPESITEQGWMLMEPFTVTPAAGNKYIVYWNDIAYECVSYEIPISVDVSMLAIGSEDYILEEELTEGSAPFIIAVLPPVLSEEMGGAYGIILPLSDEVLEDVEAITISINEVSSEYHKIPAEYLEPTDKKKITITLAEDGTITSDTRYLIAASMDMTELQGAVKIVNSANGAEYSACFATTGVSILGLPYITIGYIPAIDVRDTGGLSQSIHTLDWIEYGGRERFVHSSVQTLPRSGDSAGDNLFLVWERNNNVSSDLPDGGGTWRSFGLERYRSYLAPHWIQTETITVTEDTEEFTISTDHINRDGFYRIDDVFIRMHAPAASVAGIVQALLYGQSDSDGHIAVTANNAIGTNERYTLFRVKNVHGYLELETNNGGDNASPATWRGIIPSSFMKVRGSFKKVTFKVVSSNAKIPAGTTFEVWATNTMGDLDPRK